MTAIDQPVQLDLGACDWCEHDQWGHVRGKKACRDPGCPCTEYTAPKRGKAAPAAEPMPADDWPLPAVEVEDAEAAGLVVRPESPAADPEPTCAYPNGEDEGEHDHEMCRDVVAERDTARRERDGFEVQRDQAYERVDELTEENGHLQVEVANLRRVNVELGRARGEIERLAREKRELVDERDEARKVRAKAVADLREAMEEGDDLVQQVASQKRVVTRLREELDRANAGRQKAQDALDEAHHIGLAAALKVLWQYEADQCLTDGCGSRYTVPVEHEHPLTPVTVLVVEREVPGA